MAHNTLHYPPEAHQTPQQYPQHVPQHMPQHQYPAHVPPHHVPPQTKGRRRRSNTPAAKTKLDRPLIRFYCNDCKKKFRSRILANRNNNAVQHWCQLYQKIITRKVDSHSNKCKGDHGMGPCVVKRTDEDPDSDGEDETKAAYYADKGKTPRSPRKPRGAYTKKRKRKDDGAPPTKRARVDPTGPGVPPPMQPIPTQQQPAYNTTLPPPPSNGGYYHQGGYAHNTNGYGNNYNFNGSNGHHQSQPTPPIPNPPPMDYADVSWSEWFEPIEVIEPSVLLCDWMEPPKCTKGMGQSTTPPIPMAMATGAGEATLMATNNDNIPPRIEDGVLNEEQMAVPPPPPLEEFEHEPATEPISEPVPVPEAVSESVSEQPPLPPMESGSPVVPLPEPCEPAEDQKEDKNTENTVDTENTVKAEGTDSGTLQQNGSALNEQNPNLQEIQGTAREEMECKTDVIGDTTTSDSNTVNTMNTMAADTMTAKGDALVVEVNGDGNAGVMLTVNEDGNPGVHAVNEGNRNNENEVSGEHLENGNVTLNVQSTDNMGNMENVKEKEVDNAVDDDECINDGNTEDEDELNLEAPISPTPNAVLTTVELKVDEEDDLNLEAPV